MSLTSHTAKQLADLVNNKVAFDNFSKADIEIATILKRIFQASLLGSYKITYLPDEPLPEAIVRLLGNTGYKVEEKGFRYEISWA